MDSVKPLLIRNGRVIDPSQQWDGPASLLIKDGLVSWFGRGEPVPLPEDCAVLDAGGMTVCPGFIDMHCHLREPGYEQKETIASGSLAAARGGFTTICCMPNTNPPLDSPAMLEYVRKKASEEAAVRVLPIACVTRQRKGNALVSMSKLAAAGAVGFSDDGNPVARPDIMKRALEFCHAPGLCIINHCEDPALAGDGVINEGKVSAQFGLRGIPAAAEEKMVGRDLLLARETGGRLHLAHLSTSGSVGLVRKAKEAGVRVTCEVTPHHLTLTEEDVVLHGPAAKVNPPLRTPKDIAALILGLMDDVIDVIATDHAPHTLADKRGGLVDSAFGISGFETALGSLMGLVHGGRLPLDKLISKLTTGPARLLAGRFGNLGSLAVGAVGDVTIFDPDREWQVDPCEFASRGKNTPLAGATLKGRVMATVVGGRIVFREL